MRRQEYERMAYAGLFGERQLELVDGQIYEKPPKTSSRATAVCKAYQAVREVFLSGYDVRPQLPLVLDPDSMPEPAISVVSGESDDYVEAHPTSAVLVVEVGDSSELHDRRRKARLYARAGIPEYWISNLVRDHLEVYRDPVEGGYRTHQVLRRGECIAPLARPESSVAVEDLLPRRS